MAGMRVAIAKARFEEWEAAFHAERAAEGDIEPL